MKLRTIFSGWKKLLGGSRKRQLLQLLKQQRFLLHNGLETTAEVMGSTCTEEKVGGLLPVQLWIKLKKREGSYIYTSSRSLLSWGHIPGKGDNIRIKYLPDDLAVVLVL